jgi:hypothetical protein
MNRVTWSWPRMVGVVLPTGMTETWPCALTVKAVEFGGTVMPGCTT